jgi:hypothetical protein
MRAWKGDNLEGQHSALGADPVFFELSPTVGLTTPDSAGLCARCEKQTPWRDPRGWCRGCVQEERDATDD